MAYNLSLASQVRELLGQKSGIVEKRMFGGLCFLLHGRMCCGIISDQLMVRVAPDDYEKALAQEGVRPMDFTGKPLRGFVYVTPQPSCEIIEVWIDRAFRYVASLPEKRRVT